MQQFENNTHSPQRPNQINRNSEAYHEQINDGSQMRNCDKLLAVLKQFNQPVTRKQASKLSGFEINHITQYVKILIQEGKLQESKRKAKCPISNRLAFFIRVKPIGFVQQELNLNG